MNFLLTLIFCFLGMGLWSLALKGAGKTCPRCGHWDRKYPMCGDPWHFEEDSEQ